MVSYVCKVLLLIFLSDWITNVATEYKFHVYTADKLGAGTDAKVYIKIYGERANLPERLIDPPGHSFQQDQHDSFILHTDVDLGILSRIDVKRDSSGWGPSWDLDRMEVDDLKTNVKYVFNCYCGIDEAHRWYKITVKKPFSCIASEYQLVGDKCEYLETCQKGDTCRDPNAKCTYIYERYGCRCNPGYTYNSGDKKCKDVDECIGGINNCDQQCFNSPGSYRCGCRNGYTLKGDYKCEDIDECQDHTQNRCKYPAKCVNELGRYSCDCPDGYKEDPSDEFRCKNIDECQTRRECDLTKSTCIDLAGSFWCKCLPGYIQINNKTCRRPITCVPLGAPNGAMFVQPRCTHNNANYFGDVCTLKCLPGYEAINPDNTNLTCEADSLWQGTLLRCKRIECPPIPGPNNGKILPQSCNSQSGVEQGRTCYFFCDNGYKIKGATEMKCMPNRKWSNSPPTCEKGFDVGK